MDLTYPEAPGIAAKPTRILPLIVTRDTDQTAAGAEELLGLPASHLAMAGLGLNVELRCNCKAKKPKVEPTKHHVKKR